MPIVEETLVCMCVCVCVRERIRGRGERLREFVWGRKCDGDRAFSSLYVCVCVCVCVLVNAQQCSSSQPPSRKNPIILCIPHKFQLGFHLLAPLLHPFPLSLPPKALLLLSACSYRRRLAWTLSILLSSLSLTFDCRPPCSALDSLMP